MIIADLNEIEGRTYPARRLTRNLVAKVKQYMEHGAGTLIQVTELRIKLQRSLNEVKNQVVAVLVCVKNGFYGSML